MSTLYKKPNSPYWYAQFNDKDGRRISRSTGTESKRDATRIAQALEAKARKLRNGEPGMGTAFATLVDAAAREAEAGELTLGRAEDLILRLHRLANPNFRTVSLAEHLDGWVKLQQARVASQTNRVYIDAQRRLLAAVGPRIAAANVGSLTKEQVEKALVKITLTQVGSTARTVSAATVNMDLAILRRALTVAVSAGLARANAAGGIQPLPQGDSYERAAFTAMEVRAMIDCDATPADWRGAILIAAHSGLRLGDVANLTRAHIENDRIIIRPEKTRGKRKTIEIPLSVPCIGWLGDRQGPLFPSLSGVKSPMLSKAFGRIMEAAGVPREVIEAGNVVKRRSFHSLRHSFASWLAEADIHADIRQKLTGHSNAGIHARYSHHDKALDRAVGQLPHL